VQNGAGALDDLLAVEPEPQPEHPPIQAA
jgi:hypothetical protein